MKKLWIYPVVLAFGTLSCGFANARDEGTVGVNAPRNTGSVSVVKPEQRATVHVATKAERERANHPKKVGSTSGTVEVNSPPEQKRHHPMNKESRASEGSVEVRSPASNDGNRGGVSVERKPKSTLEASITKKQHSKAKSNSNHRDRR